MVLGLIRFLRVLVISCSFLLLGVIIYKRLRGLFFW